MIKRLFSVVIPTYNGMESLAIAIESVAEQTYANFELIVSDDNGVGTEAQLKTQAIVMRFKDRMTIRYLANEHVNGSHARNKGLEIAEGEYIVLLDDDDFMLNDRLEKAAALFKEHERCDLLFCDVAIITREGVSRTVTNETISPKEFLFGFKEIGTGSNVCFRRRLYERTGGFDESYLRYQDVEFIAKRLESDNYLWDQSVHIAKYYNVNENYLNYKKALSMQTHLREDMAQHSILSFTEVEELRFKQIHTMYNDMLVKNMPRDDIKTVYLLMKSERKLSAIDRMLFIVYSVSKGVFNFCYRTISNRNNDKKQENARMLLEYRKKLENNCK